MVKISSTSTSPPTSTGTDSPEATDKTQDTKKSTETEAKQIGNKFIGDYDQNRSTTRRDVRDARKDNPRLGGRVTSSEEENTSNKGSSAAQATTDSNLQTLSELKREIKAAKKH